MGAMRWWVVGLGLLGPGICGVARAASHPHVSKIMVLDFPADPALRPSVVKALNDFLAGAIHQQGFDVVTPDNIVAVLGLERQKQLLGCGETSCLAELGGAIGADYIVRGNVAVLDKDTALSLSLVDAKGRAVNEVQQLVHSTSSSELLEAIQAVVPKLVQPIHQEASPSAAPAAGGLAASTSSVHERGPGVGTYALVGGGVVGVAAGGVLSALSVGAYNQAQTEAREGGGTASASRSATEGQVGVACLTVGAVALVLGIVSWASSGPSSTAEAAP